MEGKVKIGYVSTKPLSDARNWSGTVANLYEIIKKDYDIVPIVIPRPFLFRAIDRINSLLNISYYPHFYSLYYRCVFNKKMKKITDVDILFGCALSHIFGSGIDKGSKKIIYLSDAVFSQMVNYYWFNMSKQRINALNVLESQSLKIADYIIYSTEWGKNGAVSEYGVSENKISVMPFPAPLEDKYIGNKTVDKNEIRLLLVGVDWKRKGIDIAIECVNDLNSKDSNHSYELDIVGLESDVTYEKVVFHGKLMRSDKTQRKELINLYQNANFFILPTKADCSPVVFTEAYEYGLPILSTKTGGVVNIVVDGETGFLFDVEDSGAAYAEKIIEVLSNKDSYAKMSVLSRARYEKYHSRSAWLNEFNKIIEKLKN